MNKHLLWLSLSGGEVTLVDYYSDMILAAKEHCPGLKIITFTTNGILPDKVLEYALFTKEQGFDVFITVSLDGDKEIHDRLRGIPGNYELARKTYNLLKKNRINCYFGLTVSSQNSGFIQDQYKAFRKEMKAVTFVHSKGIYRKNNQVEYGKIYQSMLHILKNFHIGHISEIIEKIHIKLSLHFLKEGTEKNIIPCEVLNTSVHIMADGEVKPCMYLPSLGNIKREKLPDILQTVQTADMKALIKKGECPHCWLNCYSPHNIMQHPLKSLYYLYKGA